ncbi:hypothetical protein EV426DRAFT_668039 [Tirmania nivea]|nr:hypothetical protein EV426DRAFT_668039 [Tirmania nivea]
MPSLNPFSKAAKPSHLPSHLGKLPVLAVCPPSRPHTPQGPPQPPPLQAPQQFSLSSSSSPASITPDHIPDHIPDHTPHSRSTTPPPQAHLQHSRARSYSIKNGLLSPEVPPAPGSPTPPWKSISTGGDGESFISDDNAWCESPTSTTFGENPFASSSSISGEKDKEGEQLGTSGNHTVYHIYHSGPLQTHFSIHLAPDSTSKPPKPPKKKGKNGKDVKGATTNTAVIPQILSYLVGSWGGGVNGNKPTTSRWQETNLDPRVPIYFLHAPRLSNHMPGMTLRWGGDGRDYLREKYTPPWRQAEKEKKKGKEKEGKGKPKTRKRDMKYAPAVCHIHGDPLWRKWDLEFTVLVPHPEDPVLKKPTGGKRDSAVWFPWKETLRNDKAPQDSSKEAKAFKGKHTKDKSNWVYRGLNEQGVMDGRGLISGWYPFKKGPFAWRARGETGKEWVERELARRRARRKGGGMVVRRKSTSDITAAEKEGDMQEGEGEVVEQEQDQQNEDDHLVLLPPVEIARHLWPIQLNPVPSSTSISTSSPSFSSSTTKQEDPKKGPPNPSKLTLVWSQIFSREYAFTYLSTSFYWRGTRELNHYPDSDPNNPLADAAMKKRAVEEARKKKGVDLCMWAHLKLVVVVPRRIVEAWGGHGEGGLELGLGLLGEKRRTGSWDVGAGGVAERAMARVKRRNSSFSSLWSGITRRNTLANPEITPDPESSAAKSNEDGEDDSQTPKPIQRRSPYFNIFTHSRPTTPTTTPATTTTPSARTPPATPSRSSTLTVPPLSPSPSPRPSTPSRASTWGTSASTLVPWLPRSSTFGPRKPEKGEELEECNENEAEGNEKEPMTEVVLARYSCVLSLRKAGKLVVDEDALGMVAGYIYGEGRVRYINPLLPNSPPSPPSSPLPEKEKEISITQPPGESASPEEEEKINSKPTHTTNASWTSSPPLPYRHRGNPLHPKGTTKTYRRWHVSLYGHRGEGEEGYGQGDYY